MNKKPTILAVAALGSLALIGTGFAGWVIAANAETTANGTITAYEVTDNRLVIKDPAWDSNNGTIIFGTPKGYTNESAWFSATEVKEEILSGSYSLTVKSNNEKDTGKVKVSFSDIAVDENGKDKYAAAIAPGKGQLVKAPTITVHKGDSGEDTVENNGMIDLAAAGVKLTFKVEFGWGEHFGGINPYTYYKGKGYDSTITEGNSETYGDDAVNSLKAVSALNGLSFNFTIHLDRID